MPTDSQNNPLLDLEQLPRFSLIKPEHVVPAVERLLAGVFEHVHAALGPIHGVDDATIIDEHVDCIHQVCSAYPVGTVVVRRGTRVMTRCFPSAA